MSAVILGEGLRTLVRRDGSRDALAALLLPARRVRELDELPRPLEFELVPAAGDDAAAALDELPAEPDTFERTPPPAPTAHLRPPGLISDDRLDFGDDAVDDLGDRAGDDAPASQEVSW